MKVRLSETDVCVHLSSCKGIQKKPPEKHPKTDRCWRVCVEGGLGGVMCGGGGQVRAGDTHTSSVVFILSLIKVSILHRLLSQQLVLDSAQYRSVVCSSIIALKLLPFLIAHF